jgi:hypothetical protein
LLPSESVDHLLEHRPQLALRVAGDHPTTPRHYRGLVDACRANPARVPVLVDELDRAVTEMQLLARRPSW